MDLESSALALDANEKVSQTAVTEMAVELINISVQQKRFNEIHLILRNMHTGVKS